MNITTFEKEIEYQSPRISVIGVANEGILCQSDNELTESLKENMGTWSISDFEF